ncbi:MAG: clostripain-related cysteine peptidase [Thermoplasmata archaeon]|nr:clostripain-related cysteine peptidase [Thermoplasmata archaeon]
MKKILAGGVALSMLLLAVFSAISTLVIAKPDLFGPRNAELESAGTWTVMVYLDGDNNLETYALEDMAEMEAAGAIDGVNVIVMMDTYTLIEGVHWYVIDDDTPHIDLAAGHHDCDCAEVLGGECPGELNMGDPDTLTYMIETSIGYMPADNYMLVMWDHGGGWYGVCWDESSTIPDDGRVDRLTLDEVGKAMAAAERSTGEKLNVVAFDACFSGCVEMAYEIRGMTDYMVASITTVPGWGYDYNLLLSGFRDLALRTPYEVSKLTVDAYVESYSLCAGEGMGGIPFAEMSVIDVTKIEALVLGADDEDVGGLDALASTLYELADDYYYRGLIESSEADTPQIQFSGEQFAFMDIGCFLELLGQKIPAISEMTGRTMELLLDAVPYFDFVQTTTGACMNTYGLSLYFTHSFEMFRDVYGFTADEADAAGEEVYYGIDFTEVTLWDEFLEVFTMAYE